MQPSSLEILSISANESHPAPAKDHITDKGSLSHLSVFLWTERKWKTFELILSGFIFLNRERPVGL